MSADVFACNRRPDGELEVLDTWNDGGRNNIPDPTQDTCLFSSSFEDGRIKCSYVEKGARVFNF
jgi:hypothetical protein